MGMKQVLATMATLAIFATASAASATIYTYTEANGDVLTINTATGTGTLIGANINASFSGPGLTTFTGGPNPTQSFDITITGTRTSGGSTYAPNTNHQQMLEFLGNNTINFWSYWGPVSNPSSANLLGDYIDTDKSYGSNPGTSSGGTTSGGTTSGGTTSGGTTSGGTQVPEPGDFALFGLGVAGLLIGRRQAKRRAITA